MKNISKNFRHEKIRLFIIFDGWWGGPTEMYSSRSFPNGGGPPKPPQQRNVFLVTRKTISNLMKSRKK